MDNKKDNYNTRLETEEEIKTYIDRMKYALKNGAEVNFQMVRKVDENRYEKNTNKYTIATLFPNENPEVALKRELMNITCKDYIHTVRDKRFPKKSEMRVFGKTYNKDDVYIKIRVELIDRSSSDRHTVFVMSFHFAEKDFKEEDFPFRKN